MTSAEFTVVRLGLDPDRLGPCLTLLDGEERTRAARFLRPADRARFIASHAALRVVLATALSLAPEGLSFSRDEAGRPFLAGPEGEGLDFNLSHSGDIALIGLARGGRIGVDVEVRRPLPDALRIARTHFAADEVAALAALPPQPAQAAFFGLWTRKEAVVKALGAGLSLPLDRFSVSVPPTPPRVVRMAEGARDWTLAAVEAGPEAEATVAVPSSAVTLLENALPERWTRIIGAK
jgi:4'-phosphopantetheinyl transferase